MIRIISGIIMLILILFSYWWLVCILAILLLFYFNNYYEIILWGIIYDSLYGISIPAFWNIDIIFTIMCILLFSISLFLKRYLIIYE